MHLGIESVGIPLTFGSLFAGVGGFDLGMETAGFTCGWQVEWDKQAASVLRHHWPLVPKWGDVQQVDGAVLPPVDVITFGSPCQDLSVAGKRAGMTEGTRSNLFHEAVRIIREMRNATGNRFPRWTVWENVPGALTSNNGHDFAAVLDSLADAGAMVQEWAILDAQNFGVAQRRRRIFLCSVFDPATAARCPDPLLPVGESMRGDTPKKRTKREGVTNSLTQSLGGAGPDLAHAEAGWIITEDVVGTLTPGDHGEGSTDKTHTPVSSSSTTWWNGEQTTSCLDVSMLEKQQMMPEKNRFPVVIEAYVKAKRAHSNQDDETWVPGDVAPTVNQFDQGDSRTTVVAVEELPVGFNWANGGGYGKANDGLGITENGVGPLSTSQVPAVAVSRACRRLTPLECERLQGWPDGHTQFAVLENSKLVEQADTPRYRQIGNGVASPVAAWIGEQIMRVETNV